MTVLILSLVLLIPYLLLIAYYRRAWVQIRPFVPDQRVAPSTTVTVVIAARNEAKNIGACLDSILQQKYPAELFEIIVVDDHSGDATAEIVRSYDQKNVRLISLGDLTAGAVLNSYKKKAIATAIAQAWGSLIVTTDADCLVTEGWLATIVAFYQETQAVFIAAPVVFSQGGQKAGSATGLLQRFQSLDFMTLQGITGASVEKKIHNMCNGANLAYPKKVFFEVDGFTGIDGVASGDDMLLMHKVQQRYPLQIRYLKSAAAIVTTQPAATLGEFFNQRIRWASKADKYPDSKITGVLVLVYLFNAWLLYLAAAAVFSKHALYLFLAVLAVKTAVELLFLWPVSTFFGRKKLLWSFIPCEPFHIIYILVAGWLGKFGSYTWKDRKVS